MKLQEVRKSALALPLRSREKLARELTESTMSREELDVLYSRGKFANPPGVQRTQAETEAEIQQRLDAHESGEDPGLSWAAVLKRVRGKSNGHANRKGR